LPASPPPTTAARRTPRSGHIPPMRAMN
jgi:hypothetical protein